MRRLRRGLIPAVPALCLLALAGALWLRRVPPVRPDPGPPAVHLFCGAGLRLPVEEIALAFQRRTGIRLEIQYGASNLLLGQIALSGQGDVFLPGDEDYVAQAAGQGLVAESRSIAWFVPVIQVAAGNPRGIRTLADLAAPGLRLAVADRRTAAIGRVTPELFLAQGLSFEAVRERIVLTAVTAPELGQAVTLGHADAAITWLPVARQYPLTDIVGIPPGQNRFTPVAAAVLAAARNPEGGRAFVEFLSGETAREILRRHHYELERPGP